ncbi:hypothetical protein B0H13DRAFT_1851226 [Mycena leptocephala]|nr:hypothetical protein B0H13DRAFT_1851226 [Mycena leptocephala]
MDEFYDHTAGIPGKALNEWGPAMCDPNAPYIAAGLTHPAANLEVVSEITVKNLEGSRILKAMLPGGSRRKEAVFTVVGILSNKELPPVKKNECSDVKNPGIPCPSEYSQIQHIKKLDHLNYYIYGLGIGSDRNDPTLGTSDVSVDGRLPGRYGEAGGANTRSEIRFTSVQVPQACRGANCAGI